VDQWILKERVWQSCGFRKESSQTNVIPTIKKCNRSVCLMKGGNIIKYRVKANALSKPRSNCPSTTLVLQLIQKFKHKHEKEKTLPWFVMKFNRILFLFAKNASRNMEAKQSNKFWSQKGFSSTPLCRNPSLGRNHNTMVLDHTFFIWISNIAIFP